MSTELSAGDGALKAGADAVAQAKAELQSQLSTLDGRLAGLPAQWKGLGAVAFQRLMTKWNEDTTKLINALNEFEANLTASQSTYSSADDGTSSDMSSLIGRLG